MLVWARTGNHGIGKHGAGKMNSSSLMLLEFCTRFQLSIMGHNVPTKR